MLKLLIIPQIPTLLTGRMLKYFRFLSVYLFRQSCGNAVIDKNIHDMQENFGPGITEPSLYLQHYISCINTFLSSCGCYISQDSDVQLLFRSQNN